MSKTRTARTATKTRTTKETDIRVQLDLDGTGQHQISTGIPFFDHMLAQLARHGYMDLEIEAKGDLEIDGHHTVEDVGLVLGQALREALGDRSGIVRFAHSYVPLDEALTRVVIDRCGNPECRAVWCDGGELEAIQILVEEMAREADAARQR